MATCSMAGHALSVFLYISKIDVAEEKGMIMNSLDGLKIVMWKIDHSEFVEITKFSENCH